MGMGLRFQLRTLLTLFFLGVFVYVVVQAWDMPVQAKLYPWVIGSIALVLLLFQLIREILPDGGNETDATGVDIDFTVEEASSDGKRRAFELFAWLYGFAALLWLLGFHLAIPLMVAAYLLRSKESIVITVSLAGGAGLSTWVIFDHFLHLPFPPGILFELAGLD